MRHTCIGDTWDDNCAACKEVYHVSHPDGSRSKDMTVEEAIDLARKLREPLDSFLAREAFGAEEPRRTALTVAAVIVSHVMHECHECGKSRP
jgi:hypothetical protein